MGHREASRHVNLVIGVIMPSIVSSAAWLFGWTVLAGLVLRYWLGDHLFLTRYTGYLMPWLLLGLLPGAVWAWLMHSRALSAVLSVPAAIILVLHVPVFRWRPAITSPSAVRLKVMSYNTWSGNSDDGRIASVVLGSRTSSCCRRSDRRCSAE